MKLNRPLHSGRGGVTLVELLIAISILGVIMAAIGAAVQGSLVSFTENEKLSNVHQAGRFVLDRMMRELRRAESVEFDDEGGTELSMVLMDGTRRAYKLNNGIFTYQIDDGDELTLFGADDAVTVQNFDVQTAEETQGTEDVNVLTMVKLELLADGTPLTLTASASPRLHHKH